MLCRAWTCIYLLGLLLSCPLAPSAHITLGDLFPGLLLPPSSVHVLSNGTPADVEYVLGEDPPSPISGNLKVDKNRLVRLGLVKPDPKAGYRWRVYSANPFDGNKADLYVTPDKRAIIFTGPVGTYTVDLTVVTIQDGVPVIDDATATVVIGDPGPVPPPKPPGPDPPGPAPDALTKAIIDTWAADPTPDVTVKRNAAKQIVAYYRSASVLCRDFASGTTGAVFGLLAQTQKDANLSPTVLVGVRNVVATELRRVWPEPNDPEVQADLGKVKTTAALFAKAADVLEGVAK